MADVALAFLWHQHQPYYPDDVAGQNAMPWVRLHGVKDYCGMALHLLEFPEMKCTINLVPSLLVQLLAYTDHGASDRFLDVSRVPADGLSEADALFLLDHFFMANPDHMIRPFPRYGDLLQRRGQGRSTAREALRRFKPADLRDLQVWFNLAWVHPLAVERDDGLRALRDKGRNFTEDDKDYLLTKQLDILREVLPLHRKLAERGQIELTTTPFYHPILPLLLDKKLAREAMPDAPLPRHTAGYPEDAGLHVGTAVEYHARLFGAAPHGLWPAEGSVCQSMIPLLARHGVRWIATDEEVLSASTAGAVSRDGKGHVNKPEMLYRPYKVREGDFELGIVFRDHALSDLIGFHYQHSPPEAAADDFMNCLSGISQAVGGDAPALVSVILDGENCWEHYPGGGVEFLRALYRRCTTTPGVGTFRLGDYLERYPPTETLPRLFPGSWIGHNFAIWIGHEEDNTAWDALHRTREHLLKKGGQPARSASEGSPLERAWRELYIAEGSDWFWWYGDDHSSPQDALFDYLFRKHLQNVYRLLGDEPPADLAQPISRRARGAFHYTAPRAFLDVKINGRATFFEWVSAGRYACQNERGTMAMATHGPLEEVFFGFDLNRLLLRVDCDRPAREALADCDVLRVGFVEPAGREIRWRHPGRPDQSTKLLVGGKSVSGSPVEAAADQIAELAVPFDALGTAV
ncbi:MAG TPA: glycoside hydrolase family 57 protein, partial [Gemmataceae bacterium]|nr:glycoside hydrolase family 57 protein [Gemmataceae bacterium]